MSEQNEVIREQLIDLARRWGHTIKCEKIADLILSIPEIQEALGRKMMGEEEIRAVFLKMAKRIQVDDPDDKNCWRWAWIIDYDDLAHALAGKIPAPVEILEPEQRPPSNHLEVNYIAVGYYKHDIDFGVLGSVKSLSKEEFDKMLDMLNTAVRVAKEMREIKPAPEQPKQEIPYPEDFKCGGCGVCEACKHWREHEYKDPKPASEGIRQLSQNDMYFTDGKEIGHSQSIDKLRIMLNEVARRTNSLEARIRELEVIINSLSRQIHKLQVK